MQYNNCQSRWPKECILQRNLFVVTTRKYAATTRNLVPVLQTVGIELQQMCWDDFLPALSLPQGAWVLADFDRLHPWYLEVAASRFDALVEAGFPVLNDPRRFLSRASVIRTLFAQGINSFTCWLPAFGEVPVRFPVFLRTLAGHRGVISDLLADAAAASAALEQALTQGFTITDLVFVEYRAAADPGAGHFQKHAAYRIGDKVLRAMTVNDDGWMAKTGTLGRATEETYATELAEMTTYPHADLMRRITDLCGCTYGRVDFGIVDGKVEIYEINTNPAIGFVEADHPSPSRRAAGEMNRAQLCSTFDAMVPETPKGANVNLRHLTVWPRHKP